MPKEPWTGAWGPDAEGYGYIAGIPYPTWNVTPGNKIFDLGNDIPYSWIPWRSPNNQGSNTSVNVTPQTQQQPLGTSIPGILGPTDAFLSKIGLTRDAWLAGLEEERARRLRGIGRQRGGRVARKDIEQARLRTLMRARKRRRSG